ncbi:DNA-binding transcriptional regulator, IclR family [Nonomuraea solani]|uniref:DNA-binding transcriptional regulator, IclR family n=1 Tax=Nonomuraea solani TaxID=1144553 RepID=A0A1H6ECF6_9ACTN|nr:IclR family transcriptional regulator [Nonomuraea solani]SEG95432.1 DNA-binding transcriptional regulator, IclR family [Nonomuraea solani]
MPGSARPSLRSVDKAMIVLDYLARKGGPTKLSDIARHTQIAKSTVHRLLSILESHDAVGRQGTTYALGARMQPLAEAAGGAGRRRSLKLKRLVTPQMAELFELTHHAISLAVLRHTTVHYLQTIHPTAYIPYLVRTGTRAPAHCTAAGKLLLAFDGHGRLDTVINDGLPAFTEKTITDAFALKREMAGIWRAGVAFCREEYLDGFSAIAAPINGRRGNTIACLTVSGPADQLDFPHTEPLLRRAAYAASLAARGGRLATGRLPGERAGRLPG